jgi:hypothetical protein
MYAEEQSSTHVVTGFVWRHIGIYRYFFSLV